MSRRRLPSPFLESWGQQLFVGGLATATVGELLGWTASRWSVALTGHAMLLVGGATAWTVVRYDVRRKAELARGTRDADARRTGDATADGGPAPTLQHPAETQGDDAGPPQP